MLAIGFRLMISSVMCAVTTMSLPGKAAAAGSFHEVPAAWPVTPSETYQVTAGGERLTVRRCDGRVHSASYVHVILTGPTRFAVKSLAARGQWSLTPERSVVDLRQQDDSLSFTIGKPAKLIVQLGDQEMLYLIVDAPEHDPPKPSDPEVVSILDYGVDATGQDLITGKIQHAIDDLAARPAGGVLLFPPGLYRTGTVRIRSRVTVYLSPGARLQGSDDPADYPFDPGTHEEPDRTQDIRSRLILFDGAEDAGLIGLGEIDGMGQVIRAQHNRVPNLIRVRRSRNIRIEGVILRRAAGWNTHVFHSDNVIVRNIKILSNWSDGIDIDNSRDVTVEDVLSASYDDSFAIKATWFDGTAERVGAIALRRSVLWSARAGVKIGTETQAKVMEDIAIEDVDIASARDALVIKCLDGALVHNVAYRNITIGAAEWAVFFDLEKRNGMGRIEDITLSGVTAKIGLRSHLRGLDGQHQIRRVRLVGLRMGGKLISRPEEGDFAIGEHVSEIAFE